MNERKLSLACGSLLCIFSITAILGHCLLLLVFWKNPMKRFRTPAMLIVAAFAFTNLLNALTTAPLEAFIQIAQHVDPNYQTNNITSAATVSFYIFLNASYLTMLGLNFNQYIAVRFPHKYQTIVTRKVVGVSIAVCWIFSVASPLIQALLLPMEDVSQLQLHTTLEIISSLLCVVYVALHLAYLRQRRQVSTQSNTARQRNAGGIGPICRRENGLRDRQFTTANLLLLIFTLIFSVVVSVTWHLRVYGDRSSPELKNIASMLAIIAFHLKISLDPFILVWRLRVFQKALMRVLKFA